MSLILPAHYCRYYESSLVRPCPNFFGHIQSNRTQSLVYGPLVPSPICLGGLLAGTKFHTAGHVAVWHILPCALLPRSSCLVGYAMPYLRRAHSCPQNHLAHKLRPDTMWASLCPGLFGRIPLLIYQLLAERSTALPGSPLFL